MNTLTKFAVCLTLLLSGAGFAPVAHASNATSTVLVTATVIHSCSLSATPLAFGDYNSIAGVALDAAAIITPICSSGTPYMVSLDAGLGSGASPTTRKLTGPNGAVLGYGVYTDAVRMTVWGDGNGGTTYNVGTGSGLSQPLSMYGRIPASQPAAVGVYADTITVTLAY